MNEINGESDFELWIKSFETGSEENFRKYYKKDFREKKYEYKLPIHIACNKGNFEFVQNLINERCDIEANDDRKWRPLHYACQEGGFEIVQLLIKQGCEIDPRNIANWTPLHYASGYGHSKIVKLLINNKCDIEAVCPDGWRPIHNACRFKHLDSVKILLDNKCEYDVFDKEKRAPIHHVCKDGDLEILQLLLDKGCNIEVCDKNNWRPIHYACRHNHINIVVKLLQCTCLINVKTAENKSPLDLAKEINNQDLINVLIVEEKHVDFVNKMATEMGVECISECNHELCSRSLKIRNFKKGKEIGHGGYGKVYRHKNFAIKQVRFKEIHELNEKKESINEKKENFQHKRIVKFYGAINDDLTLFIFMEFIDGVSLDQKIKDHELSPEEIIHYSWQILEGLQFLHELKIIHRDIKPLNILLTKEDDVKLVDFDFFRSISGSRGQSIMGKTFCGTANFMAPEILNKENYDCSVDIWALGATIINMFTRKVPYHGFPDTLVIFKINNTKKLEIPPGLSSEMNSFLEEILMPNPQNRPTASELLTREIFKSHKIG